MNEVTTKWYSTYCMHCINNVYDREGKIRFHYPEYRKALDLIFERQAELIDPKLLELFRNCVMITQKQVGTINIEDDTEIALLEALINVQVGFIAASHQLFEIFEPSE